jgi:hypothetical protein
VPRDLTLFNFCSFLFFFSFSSLNVVFVDSTRMSHTTIQEICLSIGRR